MKKRNEKLLTEIQQMINAEFKKINLQKKLVKEEEILYSRKQAKNIFKVTYVTLFNWKRRNVLVPFSIGGKVFYLKKDVEELINRKNNIDNL